LEVLISLSPKSTIESLLEDDFLFEEILKRVYKTQVVFGGFLEELSSELARLAGRNGPPLDHAVRSMILTHPFREKFFAKLAEVAQS
jgi:hypothetical protein